MNKLLNDVKRALRKHRYSMSSFGDAHGFSDVTVRKTLQRVTESHRPPKGDVGKKILATIKCEIGYDLLSKLEGGND